MPESIPKQNTHNNTLLNFITVSISLVLSLIAAEYVLGWNQQRIQSSEVMQPGLIRYDATIGWRLNSNWQGQHSHYDYDVSYTTNPYGFRGDADFSKPSAGVARIALLGDSFTFGLGVNDDETFAVELSRRDQSREYLNLGFPGYSTDQEYLYLKQFHSIFDIDHTVLLIYLGNDILDNALDYPLQADNAKPFFSLNAKGQLLLENTPVPRQRKPAVLRSRDINSIVFADTLVQYQSPINKLTEHSHLLKMIMPEPKVDRNILEDIMAKRLVTQSDLIKALIDQIAIFSKENNMALSIAVLPGRSFVEFPDSYAAVFQEYVRGIIQQHTSQQQFVFMDVATLMRESWIASGSPRWFHPNEGHYTREGHTIVADILLKALEGI